LPLPDPAYRGRFAPSPTGPLHFGSLTAALGSYLDARKHNGTWLLRMEDLDAPRCVPGAASGILRTLEAFGLHWDGEVLCQGKRAAAYESALQRLKEMGAAYPCGCTRKEIADSALHGIEGPVYPGTCRSGIHARREGKAWRVRTGGSIAFDDLLQGPICQCLESDVGDFVVKRADGLFAYQLAVVVDDAFQGITRVVRGSDLLLSTPRQIYLQRLLGLDTPAYLHLPTAVNDRGEKLSKQTLAPAVPDDHAAATLVSVLSFLRQQPPAGLRRARVEEVLKWAVANWQPEQARGCRQSPALTRDGD
jgi:glutamyl-Q tRNA(Asp) synthetase